MRATISPGGGETSHSSACFESLIDEGGGERAGKPNPEHNRQGSDLIFQRHPLADLALGQGGAIPVRPDASLRLQENSPRPTECDALTLARMGAALDFAPNARQRDVEAMKELVNARDGLIKDRVAR